MIVRGVLLATLGLALMITRLNDVLLQLQGKCDYVPCASVPTGLLLLAAATAVPLGLGLLILGGAGHRDARASTENAAAIPPNNRSLERRGRCGWLRDAASGVGDSRPRIVAVVGVEAPPLRGPRTGEPPPIADA